VTPMLYGVNRLPNASEKNHKVIIIIGGVNGLGKIKKFSNIIYL
jgi:signal recognition particle GTPase